MRFSHGIKSSIHRPPEQFKGVEVFSEQVKRSIMVHTFCTQNSGDGVNEEVKCAVMCSYQLKYAGPSVQGEHV